ncbi:MAG: sulfite exporter TauE/SafE family protein [FCB group bacterium]|nr:sulfite exporter TauE/SafE family protein [FCB group bacterium]
MDYSLTVLFFFVALLYSSVGLGGGSSYTALMAIFGVHYEIIPTTSLLLNMVVTGIGTVNYRRGGHLRIRLILMFLLTSIPMSYLGGIVSLSKDVFYILLLITLLFVVARIYIWNNLQFHISLTRTKRVIAILFLGGILGFVAGAVGIGGGIYLVPLIIMFGLGSEKEAAGTGTVFIFVNSLTGIIARYQRGAYDFEFALPLIAAVLAGGLIGSHFGALKFKPATIQKTLGFVLIIAIGLLITKVS